MALGRSTTGLVTDSALVTGGALGTVVQEVACSSAAAASCQPPKGCRWRAASRLPASGGLAASSAPRRRFIAGGGQVRYNPAGPDAGTIADQAESTSASADLLHATLGSTSTPASSPSRHFDQTFNDRVTEIVVGRRRCPGEDRPAGRGTATGQWRAAAGLLDSFSQAARAAKMGGVDAPGGPGRVEDEERRVRYPEFVQRPNGHERLN